MSDALDPALVEAVRRFMAMRQQREPMYDYGFRYNSTDPKGLGFFGPLVRPDGAGVMSEYSVGSPINGRETEYPSIVPTLTKNELLAILHSLQGEPLPASVYAKARAFAAQRIAQGLPPFAVTGEQQASYPDLPRAPVPAGRPQIQPIASHGPSPMNAALLALSQTFKGGN